MLLKRPWRENQSPVLAGFAVPPLLALAAILVQLPHSNYDLLHPQPLSPTKSAAVSEPEAPPPEAAKILPAVESPVVPPAPLRNEVILAPARVALSEGVLPQKDQPGANAAAPELHHKAKPGDSLWRIAKETYGNGLRYHEIFDANRDQLKSPELLPKGATVRLPELKDH